jgi:DNA processing protein
VETAADIAAQLGGMLALKHLEARGAHAPAPVSAEAGRVLAALGHDPAAADRLVELTGLPVAEVTAALVELELAGQVEQRDGSYWRLG